jgi:L-lysine 2,3-aminomutase
MEELEEAIDLNYTEEVKEVLKRLIQMHPMSITHYYLSLIDTEDKNEPIRKLCIPSVDEYKKIEEYQCWLD